MRFTRAQKQVLAVAAAVTVGELVAQLQGESILPGLLDLFGPTTSPAPSSAAAAVVELERAEPGEPVDWRPGKVLR